jgi:CheY-like chemotaxis protein
MCATRAAKYLYVEAGLAHIIRLLSRHTLLMPDRTQTILCVDDDELGLNVRRLLLESRGYRVISALSGPEALKRLGHTPVDLVLLDYYMPEMNGGAVAAEIKKLHPQLPILILSAYYWLPKEALALVDGFITKGDPPPLLFAKIEELLG